MSMTPENSAREAVAAWMIANSFATGGGDTLDDLLKELAWQMAEIRNKAERMTIQRDDLVSYLSNISRQFENMARSYENT